MKVFCPKCRAEQEVGNERFGDRAELTVRCGSCRSSFHVPRPAEAGEETTRVIPKQTVPELPAGQKVSLSVTQGPLLGKVFRLSQPRVVIGRNQADISVEDPDVSRQHCALEVYGTRATLVDLDSKNGTFVDDVKIDRCELKHLSEFRIGSTVLLFSVT